MLFSCTKENVEKEVQIKIEVVGPNDDYSDNTVKSVRIVTYSPELKVNRFKDGYRLPFTYTSILTTSENEITVRVDISYSVFVEIDAINLYIDGDLIKSTEVPKCVLSDDSNPSYTYCGEDLMATHVLN